MLLIWWLPSVMWAMNKDSSGSPSVSVVLFHSTRLYLGSGSPARDNTFLAFHTTSVTSSHQQYDSKGEVCLFWTKTFRRRKLFLYIGFLFSFFCFSFSRGRENQAMEGGYVPEVSSGGELPINLEQLPWRGCMNKK